MSQLKLALLGSPHLTVNEQSLVIESRKALAIIFYLAITGQRHSRDTLATLFWPEQGQSKARASLRQALWLLRNAGLEPWLAVDQDAIALQGTYWCDVYCFQTEINANHADEALTLYRGDLLAGFTLRDCPEFDQWLFLQADELRRQLAELLEGCVLRCTADGEYVQGLEYARRWLALDSLHEPVHRHLMVLYAYAGQHAAALRQYDECVRLLADELGVDPADETDELYQAIKSRQIIPPPLDHAPSSLPAANIAPDVVAQATPTPLALSPNNLPPQLTQFVGREAEIDELVRVIASPECRLVSIVGPGGIGKTRLALQVADRFAHTPEDKDATPDTFPHGVLFVSLSAVDSISGIIAAIAEAGGFVFYSNEATRQQLLDYLRERKLLLLLDNFEHLLAHTNFVANLLTHAPDVTILVTSREALNLQGEWLWSVKGLPVPDGEISPDTLAQYSAVNMFTQGAHRANPNFALADELAHVVRICRLVGGMPLAIELAVAWLRVIPCAQIAQEIERDLDFLTTRLRDVPDRHRSIQAIFEHSWRLLSVSEQEIFQQLSIFRGGFDRNAAEQVAGARWQDMATLVEKSLLSVDSGGRYTIHELLRQYGAGKLAEVPAARQATQARFCSYFADYLHARESMLNGPGQFQAAADIAANLDNIRAACHWAMQQGQLEAINRSVTAFYYFCQLQSRFLEGFHTLQEAQACLETLERSHLRDLTLAHIFCHQGWLGIRLGEFEFAATVLQHSRELYYELEEPPQHFMGGDPVVPLAFVHLMQGDFHHAVTLAEEALRMAEIQGDHHNLAFTHYALTATYLAIGEYDVAFRHVKAACVSTRAVGSRWFLPYVLNESGKVSRAMGNYAEAKKLFQESYEIKQEFSDPEGMAVALNHLAEIACLQADLDTAKSLYEQARVIYSEINDRGGLATTLRGLGHIAYTNRDYKKAKAWFEHSLQIALEIRFWTLVYALLLDVSHLLMKTNAPVLAVEALAHVEQQSASDYETKERARRQLAVWQNECALPDDLFAAAVQRGAANEANHLFQRILAEIAVA